MATTIPESIPGKATRCFSADPTYCVGGMARVSGYFQFYTHKSLHLSLRYSTHANLYLTGRRDGLGQTDYYQPTPILDFGPDDGEYLSLSPITNNIPTGIFNNPNWVDRCLKAAGSTRIIP